MENTEPKKGAKSDTPGQETGKKPGNLPQVEEMATALGSTAEMAHIFYSAMISAGADRYEAVHGMAAFIKAWWDNAMEQARRHQEKKEDGDG